MEAEKVDHLADLGGLLGPMWDLWRPKVDQFGVWGGAPTKNRPLGILLAPHVGPTLLTAPPGGFCQETMLAGSTSKEFGGCFTIQAAVFMLPRFVPGCCIVLNLEAA